MSETTSPSDPAAPQTESAAAVASPAAVAEESRSPSRNPFVVVGIIGALALAAVAVGAGIYFLESQRTDFVEPPKKYVIEPAVGPLPKMNVVGGKNAVFDEMSPGQTGSHTFVIRNDGEGTLKLQKGRTTCKCTFLEGQDEFELAPGEQTEVTLTYEPKGESTEWRQQAVIHSNDPENLNVILEVKGAVLREIRVKPDGIWQAGPIGEGTRPVVGGYVYSGRRYDLDLTEIIEAPDWVDVTWGDAREENVAAAGARSGKWVKVKIKPEMPVGRFEAFITLGTSIEAEPEVVLGIAGSRSGPISMIGKGFVASEMTLDLGAVKAAEGTTRRIQMLVDKGTSFDLVGYESSNPKVTLEWTRDEDFQSPAKDRYFAQVTVEPGIRPGLYDDTRPIRLDIETTHPDASTLPMQVNMKAVP